MHLRTSRLRIVFGFMAAMLCIGLVLAFWLLPLTARRMAPPSIYERWWELTEECSGHSRSMAQIRWYRMPGVSFRFLRRIVGGVYTKYGDRIVLADASIFEGPTVRHEMLHALLQRGGHPREEFLDRCASLVTCQNACIEDAGHWKLPREYAFEYARLPPESLQVDVHSELTARGADGQRWLLFSVRARNPRNGAVLVAAPGDARMPATFTYFVGGPFGGIGGGEVAVDSSVLFFRPFETKAWVFDYRIGNRLWRASLGSYTIIPPGQYFLTGAYAHRQTRTDTVTVIR